MATTKHQPIVQELLDMIATNGWQDKFQQAFDKAKSYNAVEMDDLNSLEDYYNWLDAQLTWVPVENQPGKIVYKHVCLFYFILDQEPVKSLQNAVMPHDPAEPLTPLSLWMRKFIKELGKWMDTPESLTPEAVQSYYDSPAYNMDSYIQPHGGWKTFNEFFARHFKPGTHPIAAIDDSRIITSPADSTFGGQWEVSENSEVDIKGIRWKIEELLADSPYKDRFKGGQWMHAFLNTTDYHRQHAPVAGRVLESRFIEGTVYLQVVADQDEAIPDGRNHVKMIRHLDAPDSPGYEFMQCRGLIVIDSPIGLVAVLPMGMAQVSSVVMTAEVGKVLHKGEEISYFQFGGSDIVMVFEASSNVSFTAQPGIHYKVGTKLAEAYPVVYPAR